MFPLIEDRCMYFANKDLDCTWYRCPHWHGWYRSFWTPSLSFSPLFARWTTMDSIVISVCVLVTFSDMLIWPFPSPQETQRTRQTCPSTAGTRSPSCAIKTLSSNHGNVGSKCHTKRFIRTIIWISRIKIFQNMWENIITFWWIVSLKVCSTKLCTVVRLSNPVMNF